MSFKRHLKMSQHSNIKQMNASFKKKVKELEKTTDLLALFLFTIRKKKFPVKAKEYSYIMLLCI